MKTPQDTPEPFSEPIAIEAEASETVQDRRILSAILGTMAVGAIGAFTLVALNPARAKGATKSVRLNWEQRQAAIEQTIRTQSKPKPPVDLAIQLEAEIHPQPGKEYD